MQGCAHGAVVFARRGEAVRILFLVLVSGQMSLQLREDSARVVSACASEDRVQQWLRCSLNVHGGENGTGIQAVMRRCAPLRTMPCEHAIRRTRVFAQLLQETATELKMCNALQAPASNGHFGICATCICWLSDSRRYKHPMEPDSR